jgi:hypothetical protein
MILLEESIKNIKNLESTLKTFEALQEISIDLDKQIKIMDQFKQTNSNITTLTDQIEKLEGLERQKKKCSVILANETKIYNAEVSIFELQKVAKKISAISDIIETIEELEEELATAVDSLETYEKEYLESFGKEGVCPLCGNKITACKD